MHYINLAKTELYSDLGIKLKKLFLGKYSLLTITDIRMIDNLTYFSYHLKFATRVHHLPVVDNYSLPDSIVDSFAFKYFPEIEQEFLLACKTSNAIFNISQNNLNYEFIKLSMGKEIAIMIYDKKNYKNIMEFKISDLSKFTGLCKRYKTPRAVEDLVSNIFGKRVNVGN